jgi:hypothetical protein
MTDIRICKLSRLGVRRESANGETAIQLFNRERPDVEAGIREAFMVL